MRDRNWLRGFLRLDAHAVANAIPESDVRRQEDTILRALDLLDRQSGVVLGDEVGMGKTYEALGVAAARRHMDPARRVLILTPTPTLNEKWLKELGEFAGMRPLAKACGDDMVVAEATDLDGLIKALKRAVIVIAPVTLFQSGGSRAERRRLLDLYFHWRTEDGRPLHGLRRRRIRRLAQCTDGQSGPGYLERCATEFSQKVLRSAFSRSERVAHAGAYGIEDIYESEQADGFDWDDPRKKERLRTALYRARFTLARHCLPHIDLVIVDEAHKLKNPDSLRSKAILQVLRRRFDKALLLTATPFQLDISELKHIFALFGSARETTPPSVDAQTAVIAALLIEIASYQREYTAFEEAWNGLDEPSAARFRAHYASDGELITPVDMSLQHIADHVRELKRLKSECIEPGLRRWVIRSLKKDKRHYREHEKQPLEATGEGILPFLLYERLIAEIYHCGQTTHKAAVEVNMVSSFAAAGNSELLKEKKTDTTSLKQYRKLLYDILTPHEKSSRSRAHVKVSHVIDDAILAAENGDKTLIFSARRASVRLLSRQIHTHWTNRLLETWYKALGPVSREAVFGLRAKKASAATDSSDASKPTIGYHTTLQARFRRPNSALCFALHEPYLQTLSPALAVFAQANTARIAEAAEKLLSSLPADASSGRHKNYDRARRCIEHVTVCLWLASGDAATAAAPHAVHTLASPDWLLGNAHAAEAAHEESSAPSEDSGDTTAVTIDERLVRRVANGDVSPWRYAGPVLAAFDIVERERVVAALASHLTFRYVGFLADLLVAAQHAGVAMNPLPSPEDLLNCLPDFWRSEAGKSWIRRLSDFVAYLVTREPAQRQLLIDEASGETRFARHTLAVEGREKLREAFNTPLYPMVVVANQVMQEGVDLHRNCRRIVHHDLGWNPAQLEQRVGRIDRLGSLISRLRENEPSTRLQIRYPVIRGTIDERLYRVVKTREKWLEFLLGARPNFTEYRLGDYEPPALPDSLAQDLAIKLGPANQDAG